MKQLNNGWWVPDSEIKITSHVADNEDQNNPTYEQRVRDKVKDNITEFKTFVDVGANIGIWAYPFKDLFENVICYEPSPRNLECLRKNMQGTVDIREYGLGNENKEAEFVDSADNCGNAHIVDKKKKHSYTIRVKKLDEENLQSCSLIKIDVQGYEWPVIQGAKNTIEKFRPWVVFEPNQDVNEMIAYFHSLRYHPILVKSKTCYIFAPEENTAQDIVGLNAYQQKIDVIRELYNEY